MIEYSAVRIGAGVSGAVGSRIGSHARSGLYALHGRGRLTASTPVHDHRVRRDSANRRRLVRRLHCSHLSDGASAWIRRKTGELRCELLGIVLRQPSSTSLVQPLGKGVNGDHLDVVDSEGRTDERLSTRTRGPGWTVPPLAD